MERVLPNFLIVGAAKSGTTSLYHWLRQNSEVFMSDWKEPSYFMNGYGMNNWEKYLSMFEPGRGRKAIGEASSLYLVAPESPQWIKKELGKPKIIILLRNPVDRAFSLYRWMVMEGYEWLPTFEEALDVEERRFSDPTFLAQHLGCVWDYFYFRTGLYGEQVERFLDCFGIDPIRIYLFEDLARHPLQLYQEICDFLEVSSKFPPTFSVENRSNPPCLTGLQYRLRRLYGVADRVPSFIRRTFIRSISAGMKLNVKLGCNCKLSLQLRRSLKEAYRKDILKLSALLHRDLSHWLA